MMQMRFVLITMICLSFFSCEKKIIRKATFTGRIPSGSWLRNIKIKNSSMGRIKQVLVQIYFPKTYKKGKNFRTLIGLHERGGSQTDWGRRSAIEQYADEYKFIIVCPNMGRTNYETKYYPETTRRWGPVPGGKWVAEVLIPFLRNNFAIAYDREMTGVFGYENGARGALLLAVQYPEIFGAAAGFAGFYDPASMTRDLGLRSVYGPYEKFKKRWGNDDNIIVLADRLKNTPVFLAHGEYDKVVPNEQSRLLAVKILQLRKKHGGFKLEYYDRKHRKHEWLMIIIMTPRLMKFFNKHLMVLKK